MLAAPALYLLGLWSLIAEGLGMGWRFLADSTLVPNWLLAFLTICAIIVAGILGTALRPDRETRDRGDPRGMILFSRAAAADRPSARDRS